MIFYFSATGNSRWAAEYLAKYTHDRLFNIAECVDGENFRWALRVGEHIGFVFPVHGWRVPLIVREFIKQMSIENYSQSTYTYVLCTCGDNVGEATSIFEGMLHAKGLHLNASYSLIMPESYIGLPFMYLDGEQGKEKKYGRSRYRIERYAEWICESRGGEYLDKGLFPKLYSGMFGGLFENCLISDSHFSVDKKKCIGCSQCAKVCPVGDIECQQGDYPKWKHNCKCMTCYACLHHCPVNAISWGWFTKGKGQYFYGK